MSIAIGSILRPCLLLAGVAWLAACTLTTPAQVDAAIPLENTQWTLLQLEARNISAADYQTQPNMVLLSDQKRVAGSGGCNRIMGGYTLDDARLKFSQLAGTMMACPKGMDTERQFHEMMASVAKWKIVDGKLELLDAAGAIVAIFEPQQKQQTE